MRMHVGQGRAFWQNILRGIILGGVFIKTMPLSASQFEKLSTLIYTPWGTLVTS
jgi:hypothetical protein